MVAKGDYSFDRVNVSAQRAGPESPRDWLASLIRTRRECGEIGVGDQRVLDTGGDAVLGLG